MRGVTTARLLLTSVALLALTGLTGCSTAGYYWQSVAGHLQIMQAAKPVPDWLADDKASPKLKERLALSQRMRDFAATELMLPDNDSYRRYADLQRRAVVWNVVAAPPFSLKLKTWCFPVMGCVGYRGYFDEAAAKAEAANVAAAEGLEVSVYGVPAYSTLGWMNWAGGDPLLNTFIHYPEGELARMIFHELAHQVVYAADDTMFNESFASAVERIGAEQWLHSQASPAARAEYQAFDARRQAFRVLTLATRQRLADIYEDKAGSPHTSKDKLAIKTEAMLKFRENYARLKRESGDAPELWAGFDVWVAKANNANFGAQAAYDELVPSFEALFVQKGRQWNAFYDAVKALAKLPAPDRQRELKAILE
jgi:predicted aminopeptidase